MKQLAASNRLRAIKCTAQRLRHWPGFFAGPQARLHDRDKGTHVTEQDIIATFRNNLNPCLQTLGGGIVSFDTETDTTVMEWTATRDHCHSVTGNPRGGVVQGGIVTGWIDAAMAHACIAKSRFTVAVPSLEIKVSFLLAAHPGVYRSTGWITRWGRSIAFLEGELRDMDGQLIARASSTAALRPLKAA